jgi:hypothetical protein
MTKDSLKKASRIVIADTAGAVARAPSSSPRRPAGVAHESLDPLEPLRQRHRLLEPDPADCEARQGDAARVLEHGRDESVAAGGENGCGHDARTCGVVAFADDDRDGCGAAGAARFCHHSIAVPRIPFGM